MIDRFRAFLDRPLDPAAARAILALASAIFLGVAALVVLAGGERQPTERLGAAMPRETSAAPHPPAAISDVDQLERDHAEERAARIPRQDPQDRRGSAAARRAARALRAHRALQHVPYRRGELRIVLFGARRGRALLKISAPTLGRARSGWARFLRRWRDTGESYVPRFIASGVRGG